jgi:hypothetical protein
MVNISFILRNGFQTSSREEVLNVIQFDNTERNLNIENSQCEQ